MRNYDLFKWFAPAALGLSMLCPAAALALEIIDYTPSSSFTLSLSAGNPNQDFGTVHIQSDSANGWVLRVRSIQRGKLSHSTHPSAVPYTLTVDGLQVSSLASGDDVQVQTASTLTCPPPTGCTLPVRATALASDIAGKPAGSYSDTLVFTLINQ
ncbi:hypothetical protein VB780_09100 [Leptolyngbya sp. CCNP1308]|uniref:hypothetical protein n=1 Tax=Leptolyngbya sp. CCNP1308 TaxID=3110255 RepID=UPI002B1F0A5D|nr:hypothetical protein [Leptolyngbya sp. CCNP1308]MEA5448721.1 hypothetical protein [Leptolyngbya sp. CCNP1308]